ncbi:hypothetical protein HOV17_gp21 [Halorubrum pleomorphic virus 9]|uniref:Uncharacterized protein n=1 Tax=Halorubrum pleomorphic virus 9 TaxID=2126525 RepID=A0A3S7I7J3_9VIRU|nr:hypothetical protein HOV17_gp21 [Halorubrum pleomorphic virus 9]AVP39985.1 hypothetical protein [Halorubrum pleomorphic virus 9]
MSYDPAIVGRYGKLVELWATDRYPLTLDYPVVDGLKFDASDEDGRPWDVKGSMVNGVRPTFKFWEDQHETLADADGGYALVWYRAEGREITVVSSRTVRARDLEITNWTNPGKTHYRSHSREAQVPSRQLQPQ